MAAVTGALAAWFQEETVTPPNVAVAASPPRKTSRPVARRTVLTAGDCTDRVVPRACTKAASSRIVPGWGWAIHAGSRTAAAICGRVTVLVPENGITRTIVWELTRTICLAFNTMLRCRTKGRRCGEASVLAWAPGRPSSPTGARMPRTIATRHMPARPPGRSHSSAHSVAAPAVRCTAPSTTPTSRVSQSWVRIVSRA